MKNHPLSSEEKADHALESLEGITQSGLPPGFDERMFARFDSEFYPVKTPKWFWAAAAVLLFINVTAALTFSNKKIETQSTSSVGTFYFQGGTDWYQQ